MPVPTTDQIVTFLKAQVTMFNEGRIDDFMAAFKAIAPGGFKVEDPATAPVQQGWDVLERLCIQYAGWHMTVEDIKVSGNEAVIYVRNEGEHEGRKLCVHSIEQYVFGEDGSLLARYFHPIA